MGHEWSNSVVPSLQTMHRYRSAEQLGPGHTYIISVIFIIQFCEGDGNADVGDGGVVVVVRAGHVTGTGDSGIMSSAADVQGMSVG